MPVKVAPWGPTKVPVFMQFENEVWHAGELLLFDLQMRAYALHVLLPAALFAPFLSSQTPAVHFPVVEP